MSSQRAILFVDKLWHDPVVKIAIDQLQFEYLRSFEKLQNLNEPLTLRQSQKLRIESYFIYFDLSAARFGLFTAHLI